MNSGGVLEAHNYADEEFGLEQLEAQLLRVRGAAADAVLFSVLGEI